MLYGTKKQAQESVAEEGDPRRMPTSPAWAGGMLTNSSHRETSAPAPQGARVHGADRWPSRGATKRESVMLTLERKTTRAQPRRH